MKTSNWRAVHTTLDKFETQKSFQASKLKKFLSRHLATKW